MGRLAQLVAGKLLFINSACRSIVTADLMQCQVKDRLIQTLQTRSASAKATRQFSSPTARVKVPIKSPTVTSIPFLPES